MRMAYRAVAVSVMLSLAWAGPLASFAAAQQPPPPAAPAPAAPPPPPPPPPAPAGAQPQMFQENVKPEPPAPPGTDVYDVGAVAITAFSLPLKAGVCAFGLVASTVITAMTFGTSPNASAEIVSEACGGKAQWIVHGSDLRPKTPTSKAFDWETHRFDWER